MQNPQTYTTVVQKSLELFNQAGIVLTPVESEKLEIADFGLGDLEVIGLQIITYINTARVCAKELVLIPGQTCPEHFHPSKPEQPGKEETFRCRSGEVFLYVPGIPAEHPNATLPGDYLRYIHHWHEVILRPGEQYTLLPDTPHWFQAGPSGAVISEFSTHSDDDSDIFSDPRIVRAPLIHPLIHLKRRKL